MDKIARMRELGELLRNASRAYYQQDQEIMSNLEYDKLYDELEALEKETGTVLAGSPTVTVGYEAVDELPKERHESPMLSLDKTKDVNELAAFAGEHEVLLSWKLDGLTVVLTYENGELSKAVTRGNGEIGEVITNNARVFRNIPLNIAHKGETILRGEAVIRYSDFEKINAEIADEAAKYKNPRNLCSGSVRQLNNEITAKRNVYFYAFALVKADGVDFHNSREQQFLWMKEQGFDVVEYKKVTGAGIPKAVQEFSEAIVHNDFPSDEGRILWNGRLYDELLFEPVNEATDAFELLDVTIGINFHWERKEDQRFLGSLKIIVENKKLTGINVIHVEDYLTSVISSEMSATASLELLEAHAVISRSWLLAQIHKNKEITETQTEYSAFTQTDEELIRCRLRLKKELEQIGIIKRENIADSFTAKVKKAYPAYFGTYKEFGKVRGYLDSFDNLYCIGRNGQHRYNNMDHSMLTAMNAARSIISGTGDRESVWSVNTEKEYHEEAKEQKQ